MARFEQDRRAIDGCYNLSCQIEVSPGLWPEADAYTLLRLLGNTQTGELTDGGGVATLLHMPSMQQLP